MLRVLRSYESTPSSSQSSNDPRPSFVLRVGSAWANVLEGIASALLFHSGIALGPVDGTSQTLHISVSQDVIGIRDTLHKTVPVPRAAVWHEFFVSRAG